jgi:hypothetical protein
MLRNFFSLRLSHKFGLGIVFVIAMAVIFIPPGPTDWQLNTTPIFQGFDVYQSGEFVYPPWALLLFWPYRLLTAAGTRVATVLVIAALHAHRGWSIGRFIAVILSPFFVFSMFYSNLDVLVLTLPILVWELAAKKPWAWLAWGAGLSLLLLKPQGALIVMTYLFWQERRNWKHIIGALGIAGLVTVPISLLGSPPLLLQWIDNIRNPSEMNLAYWSANNISLTYDIGLPFALLVLALVFGALYGLMRFAGKEWTINHNYMALITASLLLSPYSSNQSVIAAMAFAPSAIASILQYGMVYIGEATQTYLPYVPFWVLAYAVVALWFMPASKDVSPLEDATPIKAVADKESA